MVSLTPNQQAFVNLMTKSEEAEVDGFSILSMRPDGHKFFDALMEAGLFSPDKNKGPIPAEDPTYVSIPYWKGLDYLDSIARYAGHEPDLDLGQKIVALMVSITRGATDENRARDNYHTWRKFAEIASFVPLTALSDDLFAVIPAWLSGRFDSGTIGMAFTQALIPKLLGAVDARCNRYVLELFRHITQIKWGHERHESPDRPHPITAMEPYWVRQIMSKHLGSLADRLSGDTAVLFAERIRETFGQGGRAEASWLFRPAVEQNAQNHESNATENIVVAGLRDALLAWVQRDPEAAQSYIRQLYLEGSDILRRVALYLLNARYESLKALVPDFVGEDMFEAGLTHETYGFLDAHFAELEAEPKAKVIGIVLSLANDDASDETGRTALRRKRTWLSAIAGKGVREVDAAYDAIKQKYGPAPPHPDFLSYMEQRWGPGPSGYSKAELYKFLLDGSLVEKLNAFTPGDPWNGPTTTALVDELQLAVADNPAEFFEARQKILSAKRAFQYAFLNAYAKLWGASASGPSQFDWQTGWPELLDWMLALIGPAEFWAESAEQTEPLGATRDWIPPIVAEFLRAGTRSDDHAFGAELLPQAQKLIELLLENLPSEPPRSSTDAMTYAINSSRGKALEALFTYALRTARVADGQSLGHADVWSRVLAPLLDKEVERVAAGNPEFVILFGQFVPQLQYLSNDWTKANLEKVFDWQSPNQLSLAVSGLAYATATKPLYDLLSHSPVLDAALALTNLPRDDRARLVERVFQACLLEIEPFDGPRLSSFFAPAHWQDLETAANFLWGLRGQPLETTQTDIIEQFWRKAARTALDAAERPGSLLADLSRMVCFIDQVNEADGGLIVAIAEHADSDHHSGWFYLEELDRLADRAPKTVAAALLAYVKRFRPGYDFEGRLLRAAEKIADAGYKVEAIQVAEMLNGMPEFRELYTRIR